MANREGILSEATKLLDAHYEAFYGAHPFAQKHGHPVPSDTRAWSQILVSVLTGHKGLLQKKGADLENGSDVKAANCWEAIDTPRFNGVLPSGRKSLTSKKNSDISALNGVPHLYFVLWDEEPQSLRKRCRVWCVRASSDKIFRSVATEWYKRKKMGTIKSDNFQLHPPRNTNSNVIRNSCGNLEMPLMLSAERVNGAYKCTKFSPEVADSGQCRLVG